MNQKILGLKDIIIMSVVANMGIRWLPIAAGMGPISLIFWVLGALMFLIPISLIVAELSSHYHDEGGIYAWVRYQLGNGPAFIVSWFYWVTNLFFYPALLTFFASSFTYIFNRPELADNESFIFWAVIITFWSVTLLTVCGLKLSKNVSEFGGIVGSFTIVILLIILSLIGYFKFHESATQFNLQAFHMNGGAFSNLSSLTILMFAMAGIELIPTIANTIKNPAKNLPKGLIIAAFIILALYLCGTVAMNIIASPEEISNTTGLMNAFAIIGAKLHLPWLSSLLALLLVVAEVGALTVWIFIPVIMFFKATQRGIIPAWLHRHNKKDMPAAALIFQAVLVTIIILLTTLLPSVNLMYQALVLAAAVTYFIPYYFILASFLRFRLKEKGRGVYCVPGGRAGVILLSALVFISLTLALGLSFVPTSNLTTKHDLIIYESELIGGPILLFLIAWFLYWRAKRKRAV